MAFDVNLGNPSTNVGVRKHREQRYKGMRAGRQGYDATWLEIARLCQPTLSRFLTAYSGANINVEPAIKLADGINTKLYDGRAVWASEVLGNGMYSGLQGPSRPWFKAKIGNDDIQDMQSVKLWTDLVEKRLYDLFNRTNFYTSTKNGYQELGLYGADAGIMERHWRWGMVCHPLTIGEFWLGIDDALQVSSLYRRTDMSVAQHVERFCHEDDGPMRDQLPQRICEAYDKGDYDQQFPTFHAIEPLTITDYDAPRAQFSSVYWSGACDGTDKETESKALLSRDTFRSKPFWAARWVTRSASEVYSSTSPGLNALADVRQLQMETLRKQQALDFAVKPALGGPAMLMNAHSSLQPGRVTSMATGDKNNFFAIWEVPADVIRAVSESKKEVADAVDRAFYVQLFQAITNMQGVQPRNMEEIARRYEEQLTQLGPVVERVNQEKLTPCIERGFEILSSAGLLPEAPEEIQGEQMTVEFISVLAQAQRRVGLGGIEQTFGFASSIAGAGFTDAIDNLDADAAMREYGDITGIDARILRPKEQVDQIRTQRAQQQQAAAAAEQMAALAPAAKQGVEAAALLYETPSLRESMGLG